MMMQVREGTNAKAKPLRLWQMMGFRLQVEIVPWPSNRDTLILSQKRKAKLLVGCSWWWEDKAVSVELLLFHC